MTVHPGYEVYPDWEKWWLAARFKKAYPNDIPTPGHLQAMAAIVDGLGSPWNVSTNWDKCQWYRSARGAISITYRNSLATYDHGKLTNLVLAAHKHFVRVEIEPAGPTNIRLTFWPRDRNASEWSEKHPSLNDLATLASA